MSCLQSNVSVSLICCGCWLNLLAVQIAGVVFPVPILLLIPAREYLLPRLFGRKNLAALDPAPFEDEEGQPKASIIKRREQEGMQRSSCNTSELSAIPNAGNEASSEVEPAFRTNDTGKSPEVDLQNFDCPP